MVINKTPDPATRPKDKTVLLWNNDVANLASLIFRVGNEVLKSASGRNVAGIEGRDRDTIIGELTAICTRIGHLDEIYYPATHNDVVYEAILADYTHPQIVKVTASPEEHEPGPE